MQTWISSRTSPGEKAPRNPAAGSVPSSRPRQVTLKPETKEDKTQTPKQHRSEVKPTFAVALSAAEWDQAPQVTSLFAVRKALEQGDQLSGNIMVTQDSGTSLEISSLHTVCTRSLPLRAQPLPNP